MSVRVRGMWVRGVSVRVMSVMSVRVRCMRVMSVRVRGMSVRVVTTETTEEEVEEDADAERKQNPTQRCGETQKKAQYIECIEPGKGIALDNEELKRGLTVRNFSGQGDDMIEELKENGEQRFPFQCPR